MYLGSQGTEICFNNLDVDSVAYGKFNECRFRIIQDLVNHFFPFPMARRRVRARNILQVMHDCLENGLELLSEGVKRNMTSIQGILNTATKGGSGTDDVVHGSCNVGKFSRLEVHGCAVEQTWYIVS